jgi:hypothetical protein
MKVRNEADRRPVLGRQESFTTVSFRVIQLCDLGCRAAAGPWSCHMPRAPLRVPRIQ